MLDPVLCVAILGMLVCFGAGFFIGREVGRDESARMFSDDMARPVEQQTNASTRG